MTLTATTTRKRWILGTLIALAVGVTAVLLATQPGTSAAPAQTLTVKIRGNLGGTVYADGEVHHLEAYDGTDSLVVTARKTVSVEVTSTGVPPGCSIEDQAGNSLNSQIGAEPHLVQQTQLEGYGPAHVYEAPSWETANCSIDLK